MAAKDSGEELSMAKVTVTVNWKGRKVMCEMDQQIADFINDPDSDPETKNNILQMIFEDDKRGEGETPPTTCTSPTDDNNNDVEDPKVHIWTESEERFLISQRTNLDDEFNKTKNHEYLWGQIHKTLSESGIKVSKQQITNKWKNLKKKYRETMDANKKTGNQKRSWKYVDDFNNLFGHRASTQATCTFDSGKKTGERLITCDEVQNTENKDTNTEKKADSCNMKEKDDKTKHVQRPLPKKRSSESLTSMFGKLESMNKEMRNQMERHQKEKMRRFDRLLDLFENSIDKKNAEEKDFPENK